MISTSSTIAHDNINISIILTVVVIANNKLMIHAGQHFDLKRNLFDLSMGQLLCIDFFEYI